MKKKHVRKTIGLAVSQLKRITMLVAVIILAGMQTLSAQSYTYEPESFEESVWSSASKSSNLISSSTGEWTVAKNNVQSNAVVAQDGSYSLLIATKSNALITPKLDNGAGVLTYYVTKSTGGGRTILVETSTDMNIWVEAASAVAISQEWTLERVEINDPDVRYIRFSTNSNSAVHLDNVNITSGGASDIEVTTYVPTEITQTSALAGGTVSVTGSSVIQSRGVCYNTTGFPDITATKVEASGTLGEFTVALDNLTPGTSYYIKAYAVTANGVNYGEEVVFYTRTGDAPIAYWLQDFNNQTHMPSSNPSSPVEITVPGQGVWIYKGAFRATNASYIQDGSPSNLRIAKNDSYVITPILEEGVTDVSFYEGRGDRELIIYASTDGGAQWSIVQTIKTVKKDANVVVVNNPAVNRIKIANEGGSDADIDNLSVTVFPSGVPPTVVTSEVSNIDKNTAIAGGEVTAAGTKDIVERGVCWSMESTPLLADNRTIENAGVGTFSVELSGLPAGQPIYYRAYARSRAGTGYGEVKSFTTIAATVPVVTTMVATNVTGETAISGGTILDGGGASITAQGVCWGTSQNLTTENNKTNDTSDVESFQSKLINLEPNTVYYYRAYATNAAGTGYGDVESLTTGNVWLPSVTTSEIASILSYKVTGGGIVTDSGNAVIVSGLCWNETGTPTVDDKKTILEDVEGEFTSSIGNLNSGTTYYVRAYVTNSVGTVYGKEVSFTTDQSTVLYVSPTGNDELADGTKEKPFYSVQKAIDLVSAGDTIYMLGGTYSYSERINVSTFGAPDGGTICLFASKGERALLDFSSMPTESNNQGIRVSGSYWHFYGLDVKGAGDNGMLIERNKPVGGNYNDIRDRVDEAHHNIVEFCTFFDNRDTGLQLKNLAEYNRIINCDSYNNRDPKDGDADGFAPKLTVGTGTYFYGCRAWNNSDDGWDGLLTATENGFPDDMTTVIENCWAFANGFLKDGSEGNGNGNGFKLGGSGNHDQRHNMILKRCLAFDNLMKGFDQNHNAGNMTLINCTGHSSKYLKNKNHYTYKIDEDILAPGKELTLINSVAVWDGLEADKSAYTPCRLMEGVRYTCDFLTSASDYITLDTLGVRAPRKADGSLPDVDFMKIAPGNLKLIDTGTIVEGIEYNGDKPDLGCFETGDPLTAIEDTYITPRGSELLIYPQPATVQFTVKVYSGSDNGRYHLKIYDLRGQVRYQEVFYGDALTVERGDLEAGVYVLYVTDEISQQTHATKLIIK